MKCEYVRKSVFLYIFDQSFHNCDQMSLLRHCHHMWLLIGEVHHMMHMTAVIYEGKWK